MPEIAFIMGKSASGKDKIYKNLIEDESLKLNTVILYTTRPMRAGETDGVTPSRVSFAFADTTFVMKYGNAKLNGHIVKDEESGRFVVTFTAVGGYIPIMVMDAVINKNGNTLEMLFDVDRFVKVLTTIASKSQSSTLKSVGGLLDEYEGVLMGFELVK